MSSALWKRLHIVPSTHPHVRDLEGGGPLPPSSGGGAGQTAQSFLETPSASLRNPGPPWHVESRASGSLRSGFPGTHPVPTPESWRPARDARRPGGRPAKFRVPLQETRSCVPGSGKPAVWAWDSMEKAPPRRQGHPCRLNSCSISLQF